MGLSSYVVADSGEEILLKVDRNLQPTSYEMYRKLINIEPDGSKKEFILYTIKKGQDNMVALFLDPPSEKGRSTLRLGDNMWLYIPNVGKPLRITSLQSVVGGVFNNSDILRLDYSVEYDTKSYVTEKENYILELKAKNSMVAYDRLKMWVDIKHLVPTKIEAYAVSGLLIKTLHYSKITDFGNGVVRPALLQTDSPLYKNYKSVMLFSKITKREFADEVFSLNYLPRVESLR
ncbi:MAG: outer membrane lipoprotein-sorting protein [Gammaproteobacteria bacterium]|nr:outer membrane lipoprotein-sorting protein [Gammaproteobacteria bacterium]MCW8986290.1 outer membrane lipoprotein-sorting protein [Gammaproteobacteria bacterium]MCW9030242.1 outer membrane lipoprotein-sorting protein [Gammaproteobacteria bacterium]